jgi:dephospho-CoA kinase
MIEEKKIIGLVGLIASGKGTAKAYLQNKYDAVEFRFSSILRDALDILGVPKTRDNIIALSTWSRQTFGNDLLAKAMSEKIASSDNKIIIIDGIRRLSDIDYIKDLPGFHMFAIEASPEIRYKRSIERNENPGDAEKSYETFLKDHEKETEITIPETMARAEKIIKNDGDLEKLYTSIDEIMANI